NGISTFAQNGDVRHIAHQGQMLLQTQHNVMRLEADQSVDVTSSESHVIVAAKEHITLLCGGVYIKLQGGNIELGMPGAFTTKAGSYDFIGPSSTSAAFNAWDTSPFDERFQALLPNGSPAKNRRYVMIRADGTRIEGRTDGEGYVSLQRGMTTERIALEWPSSQEQPNPAANELSDSDLAYFYHAEHDDGSPASLAYRVDSEQTKLFDNELDAQGRTVALPMSVRSKVIFWIPQS
ncbi:DUF2345 domain-containing protein, partial [Cupriavidus basilensis]